MLVWLLSAGNFVIGMGAFVVIGMLDPMAADLGVTRGVAGGALTVYALAYAVGSPIGVALTGRVSRRLVLTVGLAVFGAAAALSALAPSPGALFAARALAALGAGVYTPNAAAVAIGASPPERRGTALANVFFGLTLAQVLGVPLGSYLAYAVGWQASFALVAALAPPVCLGLWRLVPADLAFQPTRLASLGATLRQPRVMLPIAFTATFLAAVYVPYTYLAPLLADRMGFGGAGVATALLVYGVGAVAGGLTGGRVSDRIGPARTLILLAVLQILLMPVLSALPLPVWTVGFYVFVWALVGWSFMAPQQALLVRRAPEGQNVALALNAAAIYVGAAAGSALGGATISRFGLGAVGVAGALFGLVALANLALALRPPKG